MGCAGFICQGNWALKSFGLLLVPHVLRPEPPRAQILRGSWFSVCSIRDKCRVGTSEPKAYRLLAP
jgi:hypothetical protein